MESQSFLKRNKDDLIHTALFTLLLVNTVLIIYILVLLSRNGFFIERPYRHLRRQGNPYLDFPVIRAPTTKFPNW